MDEISNEDLISTPTECRAEKYSVQSAYVIPSSLISSAPPTLVLSTPADSIVRLQSLRIPSNPPHSLVEKNSSARRIQHEIFQRSVSAIELHRTSSFASFSATWFQDDLDKQHDPTDEVLDHLEICGNFVVSRLSENDFQQHLQDTTAPLLFISPFVAPQIVPMLVLVTPSINLPINFLISEWHPTPTWAVLGSLKANREIETALAELQRALTLCFSGNALENNNREENLPSFIPNGDEILLTGLEVCSSVESESAQGAMLPENVLLSIIQKCDESDVFQWRSVNRQWNSACGSWLRSTKISKIYINGDDQIHSFLQTIPYPNITLFRSYGIEECAVDFETPAFKFLTRFGPLIEQMEFHRVTFSTIDLFLHVLSYFPYLNALALDITSFKGARLSSSFLVGPARLKNLTKMNIYVVGNIVATSNYDGLICDIFGMLAKSVEVIIAQPPDDTRMPNDFNETLARHAVQCKSLRKFGFDLCVSEKIMKGIAGARLPLEDVNLIVKEDLVRSSILYNMLKAISGTLKWLKLKFQLNGARLRNAAFELPPFAKLKGLVLENFFGGPSAFSFLQKCQTLRCLDLLAVPHYENMLPARMKALEGMEELKITPCSYPSMISFQRIMGIFPNLTHLFMEDALDFALRGVFMELHNLQVLYLKGNFTDEGITGIPKDRCAEIVSFELAAEIDPDFLRVDPFLGDLTKLRKLYLDSENITDLSITMAIVACNRLKHLAITSGHITTSGIITLTVELHQLKHLDVSGCPLVRDFARFIASEDIGKRLTIVFSNSRHLSMSLLHGAVIKRVRFSKAEHERDNRDGTTL